MQCFVSGSELLAVNSVVQPIFTFWKIKLISDFKISSYKTGEIQLFKRTADKETIRIVQLLNLSPSKIC